MNGKQVPFFATKRDISEMCGNAMQELPQIKFIECGLFDSPHATEIFDPNDLREFAGYMIVNSFAVLYSRAVEQRKGGVKYAFDPGSNGRHTVIRTGGMASAEMVLPGDIALMSDTPIDAQHTFSIFEKAIKSHFVKIKTYRVGSEAAALLDKGGRLALTIKSPREFDLER
jgi:hypothetical protein